MNQVKEDACFVSTNYYRDIERAKCRGPQNDIALEYVLPDYSSIRRGFIRPKSLFGKKAANGEQVLFFNV